MASVELERVKAWCTAYRALPYAEIYRLPVSLEDAPIYLQDLEALVAQASARKWTREALEAVLEAEFPRIEPSIPRSTDRRDDERFAIDRFIDAILQRQEFEEQTGLDAIHAEAGNLVPIASYDAGAGEITVGDKTYDLIPKPEKWTPSDGAGDGGRLG